MAMACKKRITRLRIYYVTMAWLNVAALGSMFASLAILDAPVAFDEDPLIVQATFQPNADIPASNALFEALAAASTNEKLKDTYYIYAYQQGKSQVRVCTDLTREEFEETTKVTEDEYFRWDWIRSKSSTFFKNCLNATTLAYNGGCTERIAYQDGHNFHTW